MGGDEALQLGDELRMSAQREVGVDPFFERRQTLLLELGSRGDRERLRLEVLQRFPAPERECGAKGRGGFTGACGGTRLPPQHRKLVEVESPSVDVEHVARRLRAQA